MARSEQEVPALVFAGRRGWLVQDFIEQLENCGYLDGKVIILDNVTDGELDLLYRRCILTVFPSFAEGWGLPVGESLGLRQNMYMRSSRRKVRNWQGACGLRQSIQRSQRPRATLALPK